MLSSKYGRRITFAWKNECTVAGKTVSTFSILDVNKSMQFYWEVGCYNPYSDEAMGLTTKE